MKKIIAVLLSVCFVLSSFAFSASAKSDTTLTFNKDGSFKILQISDMQDGAFLNQLVKEFVDAAVKNEMPDLVVLTGDNIAGYAMGSGKAKKIDTALAKQGINQYMSIFEKYGVPVAMVFGNHDDQNDSFTKETLLSFYEQYDCFVGYDDVPEMYGCATYNLPIYASDNSGKIKYNLWMFDSNTYDSEYGGYDYVHQDQVDWYVNKSNELKAQNGGEVVPSMAFQHIIVKEIYNTLEPCTADTPNSYPNGDQYYHFKSENYKAGFFKEWPCPASRDGSQFNAMVNQGDVVAMFFGHDHNNTFEVSYKGIDLCATPGFTFQSYGNEDRGARVITLNENDTSTYETHLVHWATYFSDSKLAMAHYNIYASKNGWESFLGGLTYVLLFPLKSIFGYIF